jgi:hypothetical protein
MTETFTVSTRYEGPTNSHGSRIIITATLAGKRVRRTFAYDYAASDAHTAAAVAFARMYAWGVSGFRYQRETRSGRGKVLAAE